MADLQPGDYVTIDRRKRVYEVRELVTVGWETGPRTFANLYDLTAGRWLQQIAVEKLNRAKKK